CPGTLYDGGRTACSDLHRRAADARQRVWGLLLRTRRRHACRVDVALVVSRWAALWSAAGGRLLDRGAQGVRQVRLVSAPVDELPVDERQHRSDLRDARLVAREDVVGERHDVGILDRKVGAAGDDNAGRQQRAPGVGASEVWYATAPVQVVARLTGCGDAPRAPPPPPHSR